MSEELLDVVNEKGEIIDTLPRSVIHGNPSLLHRVVHLLVFNSKGAILLQKRSMSKDVAPGRWDTSVGGHVDTGESIEAALRRETEEELGIRNVNSKFLYTYIHSNEYESELVYTYSSVYDGEVVFEESDIDEVRPWSIDKVIKNIGTGELSDNFEYEIRMYLKHKENNRLKN